MKDTLNVAVVGTGLWGRTHLLAYRQHPRVNLQRVCDVDPERAARAAAEFGGTACADYQEIAGDEQIDAVSVATPDFLHCQVVLAMLKAGKHVLVEKPLATETGEAREMAQAARAAGKYLSVDFHNRWNPPVAAAKERIRSGSFGEPVMASARLANTLRVPRQMLSWAGRSGPQWFLFPHIVDMICWLFDRQAVRATASGHKGILQSMGINAYDAIQALVEFEDCSATFETTWVIPETYPLAVDFNVTLFGSGERIGLSPLAASMDVAGAKHAWPVTGAQQEIHGTLIGWQFLPIWHFADSLLAGRAPMCPAEEGFHNTAIIRAIEQSIERGDPVAVEAL
ncbi:MAG: Gfo/Idh/MocA family oxidoreductase [Armatimonadetes bacterium]|nr:Gfo/Idh/MocA family oxidoreductase [Armatimonadota bacterium]